MSKELVISSSRHETKVAILEDDQLVEIYFQRSQEYSLAGSIHKGRVTRVLPGMQSAFVDLGLERDTFLYVTDFFEENDDFDKVTDGKSSKSDFSRRDARPIPPRPVAPPEPAGESAGLSQPADTAAPALGTERSPKDRSREDRTRGRRRRGRGRGFPESKYASEISSAPSEPVTAIEDESEETSPREIILLPGESLAKYRNAAPVETKLADEETEPEPITTEDSELPADVASAETEPQAEEEDAPVTPVESGFSAFPETAVYIPPVVVPVTDTHKVPEPEIEAGSADVEETPDEIVEGEDLPDEAVERAEELTGSSDIHSIADLVADTEVDEEDETAEDDTDDESAVDDIKEEVLSALDGETLPETRADAEGEKSASATVRESSARYLQRGGRGRRRRRGGRDRNGGERGERTAERPEREAGVETALAPREERPSRERDRGAESAERADRAQLPSITDLLQEGQEIIVQIAKEPLGQKGARITSHVALPGRYVVYMPSLEHLGVSRKIESEEERHRLKRILQASHHGLPGGFIVRTAGEGRSEAEIAADMQFLYNLWLDIRQKAEKRPAPLLLHHDLDIVQRTLRDQMADDFKAIWVDNEEVYESVLRFMQRFQPAMVSRVKLYTRSAPIFEAFNITNELEKALRPKVWLKSGGYIVINQTEALVAIDINTGKYVGKSNRLEDTIVKTNVEAVREIVRQIRLRDLGGIIVVDFIDMDERKNRQKVMQALEEAMRADRAPYKILQFNDFGLVAITRKRVKQSLERTLCAPCPMCEGAGYVKSTQTVVGEILQEAHKIAKVVEGKDVLLRAHPEVAKYLKSASNQYLEELEGILGRPVLVKSDPMLHPDKFDLA